jgi:hypothetical protein
MKRFNNVLLPDYSIEHHDEDVRMVSEAEFVKNALKFCYTNPTADAKIIISVEHSNGNKAIATLFDHVVLVDGLIMALEDFQTEL